MRMRAPNGSLPILLLVSLGGCTLYSAKQEIEQAVRVFLGAFNAGDVDATMEQYISTPGASTTGDGILTVGRDAIEERILEAYQQLGRIGDSAWV